VLEQDYAPLEYLVYDAQSTDGTAEVLARYADRIRVVVAPDAGQADAINRGLRSARGEIVAWLNSDDVYLPGAIARAVDHLTRNPQHAMVYGAARYIDAAGSDLGPYPTRPVAHLAQGCYICQPATFMRRQAVATVGYLDASLHYCMDYDLWLRLTRCFSVGQVADTLACSRLHADAKTVAQQLAFHREVVHMTHRRLGATPLAWLHGYAQRLVRQRWPQAVPPLRSAATLAATVTLALRYHRRMSRADLAYLWRSATPFGRTQ
jgi:GT2 family glycosyltransferase